jgi:hypothetical protein
VRVTITVPERAAGIADALFSLTLISSIRIARPYDCRTSAVSGCHACLRAHGFLMLLSVAVRFPAGGGSFTLKERCAHDHAQPGRRAVGHRTGRRRKDQTMTDVVTNASAVTSVGTNPRAMALAERLEQGAHALTAFARELSDAQWHTRLPGDGRTVGVVVHHVASMYPVEIQLAQTLAGGLPVTGVTWDVVHAMNAGHALEHATVTQKLAIDLLLLNSHAAATAIRALSDEDLAQAAPVSLYDDTPLTCQFLLEDHAVRHSYHHLSRMRQALQAPTLHPAP